MTTPNDTAPDLGPLPDPDLTHDRRGDPLLIGPCFTAQTLAAERRRFFELGAAQMKEQCAHLAGELQALRNHVAHWHRSGIDTDALSRAESALREWA